MTKKLESHIATNIKTLRRAKGYKSANSFAEAADIPFPTLRDIEAGISQGRPDTRRKIATALGVTEADLFRDPNTKIFESHAESASDAELIGRITVGLSTLNQHELRTILGLIEEFHSLRTSIQKNEVG